MWIKKQKNTEFLETIMEAEKAKGMEEYYNVIIDYTTEEEEEIFPNNSDKIKENILVKICRKTGDGFKKFKIRRTWFNRSPRLEITSPQIIKSDFYDIKYLYSSEEFSRNLFFHVEPIGYYTDEKLVEEKKEIYEEER